MGRKWIFYSSAAGKDQVAKEIRKAGLNRHEAARLERLMRRRAEDREMGADDLPLTGADGLRELRMRGNHRIFRLVYAVEDDGLVLLALHFFTKKKQVDEQALDVAARRYRFWRGQP